jgi:hypothetical protein
MGKHLKALHLAGALLATAGSFLPWETGGDLLAYWLHGLYINNISDWLRGLYLSPIVDNGGLLVIFLSTISAVLVFLTPRFIKRPQAWILTCTLALVLVSVFRVADILVRRFALNDVFWAPRPEFGLLMVLLGSLLMFGAGVSGYRKQHLHSIHSKAFVR